MPAKALILVVALVASSPPPNRETDQKIRIYISGPENEGDGGFVAVSKGISDSVKDLQKQLKKSKVVQLSDEENADLHVVILNRSWRSTGETEINTYGKSTTIGETSNRFMDAEIRANGEVVDQMSFHGTMSWRGLTNSVKKQVEEFAKTNHKHILSLR